MKPQLKLVCSSKKVKRPHSPLASLKCVVTKGSKSSDQVVYVKAAIQR